MGQIAGGIGTAVGGMLGDTKMEDLLKLFKK
jgi:hypothetical protein